MRGWDRDGIVVALRGLGETRVGLRGRHQAANAAVADAVLDALAAAGIAEVGGGGSPARLRRGALAGPARAARDDAHGTPDGAVREVLLDGAHNPAGAAVLARALDDLRSTLQGGDEPEPPPADPGPRPRWPTRTSPGVLAALAASPVARAARVICTQVDLPRALPAERLAKGWSAVAPGSRPVVVRPVEAALERALAEAPGPVVVAGSLYLVGAVRAILVDDPELRDEPADAAAIRAAGPEALAAVR